MSDFNKLNSEVNKLYKDRDRQNSRGTFSNSSPKPKRVPKRKEKNVMWCDKWKFYTEDEQQPAVIVDLDKERKKIEFKRKLEAKRKKQIKESKKMYKIKS